MLYSEFKPKIENSFTRLRDFNKLVKRESVIAYYRKYEDGTRKCNIGYYMGHDDEYMRFGNHPCADIIASTKISSLISYCYKIPIAKAKFFRQYTVEELIDKLRQIKRKKYKTINDNRSLKSNGSIITIIK